MYCWMCVYIFFIRCRYVIGLKVPKFSGLQPSLYYDTSEPQHTAVLVPAKQTSATGYHDLLLVAGEAHDQVRASNTSHRSLTTC